MAYSVRITKKAEDDLSEIVNYVSETLMNKRAAAGLISEFQENSDILKTSPYAFSCSADPRLNAEGYRKFIFKKNYIALYLIDDLNKEVSIMRIFYAKSNYPNLI